MEKKTNATMRNLPAAIRPYEKAEALGADRLSDAELLAVMIKSGTREKSSLELAQELLNKHGGLRGLGALSPEDLREANGIGRVKAVTLKCALELGGRMLREKRIERRQLTSVKDVADLYSAEMDSEREEFRIVLLDSKSRIIRDRLISVGTSERALVDPREVFFAALSGRASALLVMHNHPSGDPAPSPEDFSTTRRLFEAGRILGITLVDHIIFGAGCYYSFHEQGDMFRIACPEEKDRSGKGYWH